MGRKKFFNFKNLFLVSFLAIAGIFSAGAFVVNEQIEETPVAEKAEAATTRTLKLHYNEAGDDKSWETLDVLYGHDNQYECVVYLKAGCMFGFQVFNGDTQVNWVGYKSNLSSTYFQSSTGSDGGNIKVKSGQSGVYSIYISSDIDNYGGHGDGYWIWQNNKSGMTKLSDSPAYVLGKIKGQNKWSTSTKDYPFTWDATSHRYKATLDLYVDDEIKIYRTSDSRYTGWAAALTESASGSYGFVGDSSYTSNIPIIKKCRLNIYLGASYNFYGDAEAGWIADPSSDTSGKNYYFSYMEATALYDVTISKNVSSYGMVSQSSINDVPDGSSISVSSNTITINGTTVTATPASETAQYTYAFSSWSNTSGTITANRTITANFTRTTRKYTVSFVTDGKGYGTVSGSSIANIPYNTAISVSGNTVTINGTTITATPAAATAQYTYAFDSWSNTSGTVTGARTITAIFTRTTNKYTVSFNTNNAYGTVSGSSIANVPYGSAISVSSNTVTINGSTITATPIESTAEYTYRFTGWSNTSGTVTGVRTITANFERVKNSYTVTIAVNNAEYGSVSKTTVTSVPYGTELSTDGNTVSINGTTVTATATAATAQYTYAFSSWTNGTATVTGDLTVTANFTRSTNQYTVSFNVQGHGSTPTSQTISYGGKVSRPVQPSEAGYLFGGWYKESTCENEWNFNNDTVTGTTVLYAKWTKLGYVEFLRAYDADPQYSESIVCYLNEDMPTLSELPTREGYTFAGFFYEETGVQYYNADGTSAHVWDHNEAHLVLTARWVDKYAVTITAGDGIDSVYLSSDSSATSGSASGSSFDVGSTVYGFAVLEGGYAHASASWTLVSGTADTKGAIYRVGSITVSTSGNDFGTIDALSGESAAITFATNFNTRVGGICVYAGGTNFNTLKTEWNGTQQTAYNNLEGYQKYWLDKDHASSDDNVQDMFAMYDYIAHKYGTGSGNDKLHDFLNRNNGAQAAAVNNFSPFDYFNNDENNLSTLIIVIASSISLLSITALSVLMVKKRKRKEQ